MILTLLILTVSITCILSLILMFKRKYFKIDSILTILFLIASLYFIVTSPINFETEALKTEETHYEMADLQLARRHLLEENYEAAQAIIADIDDEIYGQDLHMLKARQAFLNGDYERSMLHYQMIEADELDEFKKVKALYSGQIGSSNSESLEETKELILSNIDDLHDVDDVETADDLRRVVRLAVELEAYFESLKNNNLVLDEETIKEIEKAVRKLNKEMVLNPSLDSNEHLRISRLKGFLLTGDYDAVAEAVDKEASTEELMIASELYLSGLIKEKDFSDEYDHLSTQDYNRVIEQVEDIVDENMHDESRRVKKEYKNNLDILDSYKENTVLEAMKKGIKDGMKDEVDNTTSKAYLQLSKIEQNLGDDSTANKYISSALETAYASDDEEYKAPMNAIINIITSSDDQLEEIREISAYVDNVLDHSVPFDADDLIIVEEEVVSEEMPFVDFVKTSVVQKTATITIGHIDTSSYPMIRAKIQLNENDELKNIDLVKNLKVVDTYINNEDFKLEKVEYNKSKIVLLCDVSGSMEENVSILKNTIVNFADQMNENEEVSVVGFDSTIVFASPFSDDPDTVATYANEIDAYGGTNMFESLMQMETYFDNNLEDNNIVILMTDGMDGGNYSNDYISESVRHLSEEKGLTVYTVGLGSEVNDSYLNGIAEAGNGSFLYVDDESTLNAFYEFIHTQATNQYLLEYTVKNEDESDRMLNLSFTDSLARANKYYNIDSLDDTVVDLDEPLKLIEDNETLFNGLVSRDIYKSSSDQVVKLSGKNLDNYSEFNIQLTGPSTCSIDTRIVDENTLELTIPASINIGSYDLSIQSSDLLYEFKNELQVLDPNADTAEFKFGDFKFTAKNKKYDTYGNLHLSGNVIMNNYLRFKGDIIIENAQEENMTKLRVLDQAGSYIEFKSNSVGLAKMLYNNALITDLGILDNFYIYNDSFDASDYKEFPFSMNSVNRVSLDILTLFMGNVRVYPEFVEVSGFDIHYSLPMQEQLFKNFPSSIPKHKIDLNTSMIISNKSVGFDGKFVYKNFDENRDLTFKVGKLPLGLNEFTLDIDTINNDYEISAKVAVNNIDTLQGLKASLGVVGGRFDSIGLQVDGPQWTPIKTPIPVTFKDFGFKLDGLANIGSAKAVSEKAFEVLFAVEVADITDYLPKVKKLIKIGNDKGFPLVELKNASIKTSISELNIDFSADAKLITLIDIGSINIVIGKFDYTNELIGYTNRTQYGMKGVVNLGTKVKMNWLDMRVNASGEITLGAPYTGVKVSGDSDFDVGWSIFKKDFDVSGDIMIGIYLNSSHKLQFSIIVDGKNSKGKNSGFHLWFNNDEKFEFKKY